MARASRLRKKERIDYLEQQIVLLNSTNMALKTSIALIESQKRQWYEYEHPKLLERVQSLESQVNDMTKSLIVCAARASKKVEPTL